jgi:hypothetical protein
MRAYVLIESAVGKANAVGRAWKAGTNRGGCSSVTP